MVKRQNKSEIPFSVESAVVRLGQHIATARKRRKLTQAALARRAGLTERTLRRLEHGDSSGGIRAWFSVLWALGLEREYVSLASPDRDEEGKRLEQLRLPKRARAREEDWDV